MKCRVVVLLAVLLIGPLSVRAADLEAVVTDLGGNRVSGLAAGDFRLLVDGAEVPIERFAEVSEAAVGRSYLVFVDDSLSSAVQRDLVLWGVERDLDRLGPDDRMAIAAFDGTRLHRLADWTNDRAVLAAAFAEARRRPNGTPSLAEQAADAAAEALRELPLPEGRRTMLVLSGGWSAGTLDLAREANRLGYTLYPVDVPGLEIVRGGEQASHDTLVALAQATGGEPALDSARLAALEQAEADTRSWYQLGFSSDDRNHRIELEARLPGLSVRARHSLSGPQPVLAGGSGAQQQESGE
jgi:VWFA-related protein